MSTLSHFADLKNFFIIPATGGDPTPVAVGSVMNFKVEKTYGRVEGENNGVVSGPVSSHIVRRLYTWSFETLDISVLNTITDINGLCQLTGVWVASTTQAGTPLGNQQVTLSQCIIDKDDISPETKAQGKYMVRGHCLATSNDSNQLTVEPVA